MEESTTNTIEVMFLEALKAFAIHAHSDQSVQMNNLEEQLLLTKTMFGIC